jgi:hypothetical protein
MISSKLYHIIESWLLIGSLTFAFSSAPDMENNTDQTLLKHMSVSIVVQSLFDSKHIFIIIMSHHYNYKSSSI